MIKRFKFSLLYTALLAVIFFSSCIDRLYGFDTDYSSGVLLTPEMIESIVDAATVEYIEKYPTETDANGELIVYWLSGGSVWHASINCSSVSRATEDNMAWGSVFDAVSAGKDRPCKICSADIEYISEITSGDNTSAVITEEPTTEEMTSKYPKDHSEDGTLLVYWTKSGSVWHESLLCPSLANTDKDDIDSGSENDAISLGKERVCKKCS